jgi:hypothetical protein
VGVKEVDFLDFKYLPPCHRPSPNQCIPSRSM